MTSDQLYKADGGKSDPTLLETGCVDALRVVNATLDYGAQKYEPDSWKGVDPKRYDKAARRHRIERDMGERFDRESGIVHIAHEIINNLFVLQMMIEENPQCNWTTFNKPPTDHKGIPPAGGIGTWVTPVDPDPVSVFHPTVPEPTLDPAHSPDIMINERFRK